MAKSIKVLLVEDNFILSMVEERILLKLGHKVVGKVASGEEAVELFHQLKPELIIMDISLSGEMDGIEATEKIREFSDVPVLFVSGNSDRFEKSCELQKGFSEFVAKPFTSDELEEPINRIINKQRVA